MLTDISNDLIKHFLAKSDINSFLKSKLVHQLYQSLESPYQNTKIRLSQKTGSYPTSKFIANSLNIKLVQRTNVICLQWTTKGKYSVKNTLNIYLDDGDYEEHNLPNTKLLVEAISYITSFSDKPRKITIHLCLLPDKKRIRKNQTKITQLNVNSGSNHFSDTESEICILRREEAIKVIFHEIIHGLRFSRLGSNEEITKRLCQKYNLGSKDILVDESYTEMWAEILNCYFISSLTNSQTKFQHFSTLLALEQEFSIYQGNKVKQFVRSSKLKDLDKDTNVSAYYLVVGEIFCQFPEFITMCQLDPHVKDTNKCLEYLYHLDKLESRKISHNDPYYNTMRMSVAELEV
jgi:hypothetical protein